MPADKLAAASVVMKPRGLALAELSAIEADPIELGEAAATAGFTGITARLSPADRPTGTRYSGRALVRIKRRLDELGIAVLEVDIARLRPETQRADLEFLIEDAAALGASYLNTVSDYEEEERTAENLAGVERLCHDRGIRPALEFMPHSHVRTLAQACRIVAMARLKSPAVLIDSLHLARSGGTPKDVAALDPVLLPYAHICDAPLQGPTNVDDLRVEARTMRRLPGYGQLPLLDFIMALPNGIPLALEVPGAYRGSVSDGARAGFDAMAKLLARQRELPSSE